MLFIKKIIKFSHKINHAVNKIINRFDKANFHNLIRALPALIDISR